jgi:release factor glutamine methyltransferase
MTVRDALREGAAALAGTETPFLDASLLLAEALSVDAARILASGAESLGDRPLARYREGIASRSRGLPVAYITGRKEFWGRVFAVDPRVLVPRPDTETLVSEALRVGDLILREREAGYAVRVHEPCCGSGCVAISLAADRPEWIVSASDLSEDALAVAEANAASILAADRPGGPVAFGPSDLLASALRALGEGVQGPFDMFVANPPYVPSREAEALLRLGWSEPRMALDGGGDGLEPMRRLVPQAARALAPGGALLVEADDGQAGEVAELFRASRFSEVETRRDLGGRARVTLGRKTWTS